MIPRGAAANVPGMALFRLSLVAAALVWSSSASAECATPIAATRFIPWDFTCNTTCVGIIDGNNRSPGDGGQLTISVVPVGGVTGVAARAREMVGQINGNRALIIETEELLQDGVAYLVKPWDVQLTAHHVAATTDPFAPLGVLGVKHVRYPLGGPECNDTPSLFPPPPSFSTTPEPTRDDIEITLTDVTGADARFGYDVWIMGENDPFPVRSPNVYDLPAPTLIAEMVSTEHANEGGNAVLGTLSLPAEHLTPPGSRIKVAVRRRPSPINVGSLAVSEVLEIPAAEEAKTGCGSSKVPSGTQVTPAVLGLVVVRIIARRRRG